MPNLPVDMNSWGRSACYPRRTFYPLSHGNSILYRRITKPCFRTCSSGHSHSQASLCLCTRRTITNRTEETFGRLRYSLGGDRPSQTTHQTLFRYLIQGTRLEPQHNKGGIPRLTPSGLASELQCLPPILYMLGQNSMLSCSKGARGLSVLSRVSGIFTGTSTSPSPSSRQCPNRYAIRAGRNLPDKEFRYLRHCCYYVLYVGAPGRLRPERG